MHTAKKQEAPVCPYSQSATSKAVPKEGVEKQTQTSPQVDTYLPVTPAHEHLTWFQAKELESCAVE